MPGREFAGLVVGTCSNNPHIGRVVLARPGKGNAFSAELWEEFPQVRACRQTSLQQPQSCTKSPSRFSTVCSTQALQALDDSASSLGVRVVCLSNAALLLRSYRHCLLRRMAHLPQNSVNFPHPALACTLPGGRIRAWAPLLRGHRPAVPAHHVPEAAAGVVSRAHARAVSTPHPQDAGKSQQQQQQQLP